MNNQLRLIVVEDDADTRTNLRDILELDGYHVELAASASEARACVQAPGKCIVILDRKLPDGSSEELLPQLRELAPLTDVIVVTGFADLDSTIAALRQGAADYILKPINPDALRASIQRIVQRWEIEKALHHEHDFADRILKTAEAVVVVLALDGSIVRFNPYLTIISGWSLVDTVGKDWFDTFLPECDRHQFRETFQKIIAGLEASGIVNPICTRTGQLRHMRWSNTTLKDELGKPTAVLAIGLDITDLVTAQSRALQAERLAAIGQTMTALAHESRNALQRIQASVEMLSLELVNNPQTHDDIRAITKSVKELQNLLDEVRSFAAPIVLQHQPSNLPDIWHRAWRSLLAHRQGRQTTLHESIIDEGLVVEVDDFRMEQVFRNLFENSLAACSDSVVIEIDCKSSVAKDHIEITVTDNGPGLAADQRERVFDAFYTTKSNGTGLGMAIVRRILEAHNGSIRVQDNPSGGAQFVLTLPVTKSSSE